jgi:hypothetical protein
MRQQLTLDGKKVQPPGKKKDSHVHISLKTVHILDMAKYLKSIPKGEFVDLCTLIGAVMSNVLPDDVFRSLKDQKPDVILETLSSYFSEYLK